MTILPIQIDLMYVLMILNFLMVVYLVVYEGFSFFWKGVKGLLRISNRFDYFFIVLK